MKKIIAISMSLVLMAGILTGCGGKPGKKETLERLEDQWGGENIEIVSNGLARSLDRDLEFTYSYDWEGTPIWPDIDLNLGGKYILESDYSYVTHKYWNDEYRRCIEKYNFAEVDYGREADEERKNAADEEGTGVDPLGEYLQSRFPQEAHPPGAEKLGKRQTKEQQEKDGALLR